jgi:hypothetical protein
MAIRIPLTLWNQPHWELLGAREAGSFFESIGELGGTDLFLEGTSQPPGVREVLARLALPGPYLPERQTIWPRPQQWRLPTRAEVLRELADLAASHAEPEVADHVFVYAGETVLVEWPDAFAPDSPILVSHAVAEEVVRDLASRLNAAARWIDGEARP